MSKQNKKGFTLLEVIITIFIVSIGLIGILSLVNISLKGPALSKDRLIASGLAQEGIEIVRDIRKSNVNWGDWEWYSGATATGTLSNFIVQYDGTFLPYMEFPLKWDDHFGYQFAFGSTSPFYRKVTLEKISYKEVKVVVEVKWQLKGQEHTLTAEDRLWNWK